MATTPQFYVSLFEALQEAPHSFDPSRPNHTSMANYAPGGTAQDRLSEHLRGLLAAANGKVLSSARTLA